MYLKKAKRSASYVYEAFIVLLKGTRSLLLKMAGIKRKGFVNYYNIGMDTREAILFRDATTCTLTKRNREIKIEGIWTCRYSGQTIRHPKNIDVDHIVPVHYAKNNKIGIWTPATFQEFENDTDNLIAVDKSLNRSKRAKSIAKWTPPKGKSWYRKRWKEICKKWNLVYPK